MLFRFRNRLCKHTLEISERGLVVWVTQCTLPPNHPGAHSGFNQRKVNVTWVTQDAAAQFVKDR